MSELNIQSPAKVNLFLEVLDKREDGYFQIETVLQCVDLHDNILIKDKQGGDITVKVSPPLNITQEANIAYKAAKLIQGKAKQVSRGAEIFIDKKIPVGRGLGGGSSNAASVLKGLNELWNLKLSSKELANLGKELGMDVPFFIYGGTCLGTERGEIIRPLSDFSGVSILIIWPDFPVSTAMIYKSIQSTLTKKKRSAKLMIDSLEIEDFEGVQKYFFNRLEDAAFEVCPSLYQFKKQINSQEIGNIIMSGSGSAFFALLPDNWDKEEYLKKEIIKIKGGYYIGKTLPAS